MAIVAQLVRASDCGSESRGFEPRHSPFFSHQNALSRSLKIIFQPLNFPFLPNIVRFTMMQPQDVLVKIRFVHGLGNSIAIESFSGDR